MLDRFSGSMITIAIAATAASALISAPIAPTSAQGSADSPTALAAAAALKTPWGEPNLEDIWTDESDTPLQRLGNYASQEFFTEAQRAALDSERAALLARDKRAERGTETDVTWGYNSVFLSLKRIGARTSLIVAPPDGRILPLTSEAQKTVAADQEFRLALLQTTQTCKSKLAACSAGKYDPTPSPRRAELPPRYNTARMNRHDGSGSSDDGCR